MAPYETYFFEQTYTVDHRYVSSRLRSFLCRLTLLLVDFTEITTLIKPRCTSDLFLFFQMLYTVYFCIVRDCFLPRKRDLCVTLFIVTILRCSSFAVCLFIIYCPCIALNVFLRYIFFFFFTIFFSSLCSPNT